MLRSVSLNQAFPLSASLPAAKDTALHRQSGFHANLHNDGKRENLLEKIGQLVDSIGKIKDKLESELTIENITEYKNTVKSFLNFYVDNMLQYKDVSSRHPRHGYPQKMTIVKQVENEIHDMEDIMNLINTKTGHLEMLNKIGEIHGLILNLVL